MKKDPSRVISLSGCIQLGIEIGEEPVNCHSGQFKENYNTIGSCFNNYQDKEVFYSRWQGETSQVVSVLIGNHTMNDSFRPNVHW